MYNLGEQFKIDHSRSQAKNENIIRGQKYRITVLTERLVRLEYNENGVFNDEPTLLAWNRNFPKAEFTLNQDNHILEITTKYFKLTYNKERNFAKSNSSGILKVNCLGTDRYWYYGHPEVRNYGTPGIFLEENGKTNFTKGLYSIEGFASIDDSRSKIMDEDGTIRQKADNTTDVYLFVYDKDFDLCLRDYFYLTGMPALLPRYALGNWWSRNDAYDDQSVSDLIDNFNDHDIPLSVLLLDKDWHLRTNIKSKNLKTGFTWNKDLFADPALLSQYLHANGVRLGLSVNPSEGIYPIEEFYEVAKKYLETDKNGVIPFNMYDPRFIDVYLKVIIHPLDNMGADFLWLDYANKDAVEEMFLLKHYHFYDMMRDYKRRPMVLGYNALTAPHRYPVLYSGKTIVGWDTLKKIPAHNANAANMGVSWWSHDIGGYFKGTEDNELYIRYVQLGVFSPILKFGADAGKYYKREPWRWSVQTHEIAKDYLQLRHRLIPYLYTEAYNYHKNGVPIVQPLFYRYPNLYDDEIARNEYYFGSQLFVSPIVHKKEPVMNRVVHKFFVPDGTWYDIFTGKKFPGGKNYVSFFKDEDYPVFAKAGAIIPMGKNEIANDTTPPDDMEIQIFPGESNTYHLYEDDGISGLYKKGFYLLTDIDYNYMPNNFTVIIRAVEGKSGIVPDKRNYKIRFRNTKKAEAVVARLKSDPIEATSYTDGADFIVEVKDVPTISQLTINCKGKDIEFDAVRVINDDIETIISDLQIETLMKEQIDEILFSEELTIKQKRIAIRKLSKRGLEQKYITIFLKLLEYIGQV